MSGISALSQNNQQRLQNELKAGESVVWVGQPDPGLYMRGGYKVWLFFIPWTAFSLFWIAGAADFKVPTFDSAWSLFPLFGLPFLLVGIGGLSSPFWMRRKAHSIVYAVTNRRVIIMEGIRSVTVKSYSPGDIDGVERTQHKDGSGDLILSTELYRDSDGDQQRRRRGFFAIADVRNVEAVVEGLVRRAKGAD